MSGGISVNMVWTSLEVSPQNKSSTIINCLIAFRPTAINVRRVSSTADMEPWIGNITENSFIHISSTIGPSSNISHVSRFRNLQTSDTVKNWYSSNLTRRPYMKNVIGFLSALMLPWCGYQFAMTPMSYLSEACFALTLYGLYYYKTSRTCCSAKTSCE